MFPDNLVYQNSHIEAYYDKTRQTVWCVYDVGETGCASLSLLKAIRDANEALERLAIPVKFIVGAGKSSEVYCTGGDLALFVEAIKSGDSAMLKDYAYQCIDIQYARSQSEVLPGNPVFISLVRGLALGGGFEFALAAPFIVAEENAKFALPEAAFNLFPGMGGFPYLYQKTGDAKFTESVIMSGSVVSNEELLKRNVIDHLVPSGKGVIAVNGLIDTLLPKFVNVQATLWSRNLIAGVSYEVLSAIADRWVEDAFKLSEFNLNYMERLVQQQKRRLVKLKNVG